MDPFSLLAGAAGGGLPPISGGHAAPSSADLGSFGDVGFYSPFAVGSGATANATGSGGSPMALWIAAGAAVLLALVLMRRG